MLLRIVPYILLLTLIACDNSITATDDDVEPQAETLLKVKFQFDPDQQRLDNFGQPAEIPADHAAQTPEFKELSIHYLELVPDEFTPYGEGLVIYRGEEVAFSGNSTPQFTSAIDWDRAIKGTEEAEVLEIDLSDLPSTTFRYLRASVSFQRYDVRYTLNNIPMVGTLTDERGTIGSFLGYNTKINEVDLGGMSTPVNDFRQQGFWLFATDLPPAFASFNQVVTGQAPIGATTVVNPFPQNPIPTGSCVVSGSLNEPFFTEDIRNATATLILSFSVNQSFEWKDDNGDGRWDIDAQTPGASEQVVDMGIRGLIGELTFE